RSRIPLSPCILSAVFTSFFCSCIRLPPPSPLFPYTTLFRSPLQRAGSADRFALGLGQRLALLHGHERGDDVGTLAQQCGGFLQRSEEHTSELQSRFDLVCRLLLEKKNYRNDVIVISYYAASG